MDIQLLNNILTPLASILVSGGISYWVYKTLSWKVKEQAQTIIRLEKEIDKLKDNEQTIRTKYMHVVAMILKNKQCNDGKDCTIFKKYIELIEKEGAI
jgi:FtsZ-binding cell division protein ZapB